MANRARAIRAAKESVAAWISEYIRTLGVGYVVSDVGTCIDDPKVVQFGIRISHDECPDGEPVQFEIRTTETLGC